MLASKGLLKPLEKKEFSYANIEGHVLLTFLGVGIGLNLVQTQ